MADPLDLGPPTGDPFLDLARYFDALAAASEGTIAALEKVEGPGEEKRRLSMKYAAGRRDAYRDAAANLREVRGRMG